MNKWRIHIYLSVIITVLVVLLVFAEDLLAEYQYWRTFQKLRSGEVDPNPPHLPVIDGSLSGNESVAFGVLIRSRNWRDRILREIQKRGALVNSADETRIRSYLLGMLTSHFPHPDLIEPLLVNLRSQSRSVYGWACTDMKRLMKRGVLKHLTQVQLQEALRLLSEDYAKELPEDTTYADALWLADDFELARKTVHESLTTGSYLSAEAVDGASG